MVGKLTKDNQASCSILETIMGGNPWKSQTEQLADCILANEGKVIRFDQNSIMRMGDVLEGTLLKEAIYRLDLAFGNTDLDKRVEHPTIPLQGSLDGLCYTQEEGQTIKEDPENGIYVMNEAKEIFIEGEGVMECKCTSVYPEDVPPNYRGPTQMQGLMDCIGSNYGVLVILYQSVHLKIFVYPKDVAMAQQIRESVIDFDRRIQEKDFYPPASPNDAAIIHPQAKEERIELEDSALDFIDMYNQANKSIKYWEGVKKETTVELQQMLGDKEEGSYEADDGLYVVKWPNRTYKPQPEKTIEAKPGYTVRSKTITIREYENEI
jgi:hypothetical protein